MQPQNQDLEFGHLQSSHSLGIRGAYRLLRSVGPRPSPGVVQIAASWKGCMHYHPFSGVAVGMAIGYFNGK